MNVRASPTRRNGISGRTFVVSGLVGIVVMVIGVAVLSQFHVHVGPHSEQNWTFGNSPTDANSQPSVTGLQVQDLLARNLSGQMTFRGEPATFDDGSISCPDGDYHDGDSVQCTGQANTSTGRLDLLLDVTLHHQSDQPSSEWNPSVKIDLAH